MFTPGGRRLAGVQGWRGELGLGRGSKLMTKMIITCGWSGFRWLEEVLPPSATEYQSGRNDTHIERINFRRKVNKAAAQVATSLFPGRLRLRRGFGGGTPRFAFGCGFGCVCVVGLVVVGGGVCVVGAVVAVVVVGVVSCLLLLCSCWCVC